MSCQYTMLVSLFSFDFLILSFILKQNNCFVLRYLNLVSIPKLHWWYKTKKSMRHLKYNSRHLYHMDKKKAHISWKFSVLLKVSKSWKKYMLPQILQKKRTLGHFSVHKNAPAFFFWKNQGPHIFFRDLLTFHFTFLKFFEIPMLFQGLTTALIFF